MSQFNRKGYTQIRAKDPNTGKMFWMPVKIGSSLHKRYLRDYKKWAKERKDHNRKFKEAMKEQKRLIKQQNA